MVLKQRFESPLLRSYRELLGVTSEASSLELKKAYHRMALLYHPDRNAHPNASAQFARVQKAFEILSSDSEVAALNRDFNEKRWAKPLVHGLDITLGSFFGYRTFSPEQGRIPKALRLTGKGFQKPSEKSWSVVENQSILDHPAYDAIEVVFAGKHSANDEEELHGKSHGEQARDLPWVVLNNQGLYHVFRGEIDRALVCYEQLNLRVPGNLVFMYRLAVCELVLAFEESRTSLFGKTRPKKVRLKRAIRILEKLIQIGEKRSVGRQKCLVARKLLAEILLKNGSRLKAGRVLRKTLEMDEKSIEVLYRLGRVNEAEALVKRRKTRAARLSSDMKFLSPTKAR